MLEEKCKLTDVILKTKVIIEIFLNNTFLSFDTIWYILHLICYWYCKFVLWSNISQCIYIIRKKWNEMNEIGQQCINAILKVAFKICLQRF